MTLILAFREDMWEMIVKLTKKKLRKHIKFLEAENKRLTEARMVKVRQYDNLVDRLDFAGELSRWVWHKGELVLISAIVPANELKEDIIPVETAYSELRRQDK